MISELEDKDILEYLMTSDYIENYKPEEYKFLLHKFRYFYRILHGNHTRIKGEVETSTNQLSGTIESLRKEVEQLKINNANLQNTIDLAEKGRPLSWSERFSGKINKF